MKGKANHQKKKLHELSISFCDKCRYCFDLTLCKIVDFNLEKVNCRDQMQTKTLYNLYIYIDENYKNLAFHVCACIVRLQDSFATSLHVCCVLLVDFVKTSGIECCLWSAQCTEIQARTSDIVKTWVFSSLNVQ